MGEPAKVLVFRKQVEGLEANELIYGEFKERMASGSVEIHIFGLVMDSFEGVNLPLITKKKFMEIQERPFICPKSVLEDVDQSNDAQLLSARLMLKYLLLKRPSEDHEKAFMAQAGVFKYFVK